MKKVRITINDEMQSGYHYFLSEPVGKNFHPDFHPELSPQEMLELGVFGGRYLRDCQSEYPLAWFTRAKLHPLGVPGHSPKLNYFLVDASQPLLVWQEKGWIYEEDPRGWFQWYCRYYMGRRCQDDLRQIKRWRMMKRHVAQLTRSCLHGDLSCRPVQRQALLHWAYDSRKI